MKRLVKASSSALFLLELAFSILIFAIACAACVGLLVRSHSLNREAERLNLAVREVSSAAELIRGAENIGEEPAAPGGSLDTLLCTLWPQAQRTENGWVLYYDEDGAACAGESDSAYVFRISAEKDGQFLIASLTFTDADGEEIYAQQLERYMTEGGEADAGA